MPMNIFNFIALILTDNIILRKSDFKELKINKNIIKSESLKNNEIIKISYPGYLVYKIEVNNGIHILKDCTVYLKEINNKLELVIEKEGIFFNVTYDTWCCILFCGFIGIFNLFFFYFFHHLLMNLVF